MSLLMQATLEIPSFTDTVENKVTGAFYYKLSAGADEWLPVNILTNLSDVSANKYVLDNDENGNTTFSTDEEYDIKMVITDEIGRQVSSEKQILLGNLLIDSYPSGCGLGIGTPAIAEKHLAISKDWSISLFGMNLESYIYTRIQAQMRDKSDYVTEQNEKSIASVDKGTGTWYYRKWYSGHFECWGQFNVTSNAKGLATIKIQYPVTIYDAVPVASFASWGNSNAQLKYVSNQDGSVVAYGSANANANSWFYIQVKGRWK